MPYRGGRAKTKSPRGARAPCCRMSNPTSLVTRGPNLIEDVSVAKALSRAISAPHVADLSDLRMLNACYVRPKRRRQIDMQLNETRLLDRASYQRPLFALIDQIGIDSGDVIAMRHSASWVATHIQC